MRKKPQWFKDVDAEFEDAIGQVLRGMSAYRGLMETLERKASAEKELANPDDEEWIAAMNKVIRVGQRGQETADRGVDQWRNGPGEDLMVVKNAMPVSWED